MPDPLPTPATAEELVARFSEPPRPPPPRARRGAAPPLPRAPARVPAGAARVGERRTRRARAPALAARAPRGWRRLQPGGDDPRADEPALRLRRRRPAVPLGPL